EANETAIGNLPRPSDLNLAGLDIADAALDELLSIKAEEWRAEAADMVKYFDEFGERTPAQLLAQVAALQQRLG
ncbi:MAG: phosphoenolpyruvate carboxykinase domain-containing protein, partial [Gammaproteobacteria bacterium]